jgi:hypothetical protein
MSTSESGSFRHVTQVNKWSEAQTQAAAEHFGLTPDELTHDQFVELGWIPEETIEVDHDQGIVTHTDEQGQKRILHIDEWNAEKGS